MGVEDGEARNLGGNRAPERGRGVVLVKTLRGRGFIQSLHAARGARRGSCRRDCSTVVRSPWDEGRGIYLGGRRVVTAEPLKVCIL